MNEHPYNERHLQEYTGILTSHNTYSERFKMELKVEDNPVLKDRWTEKNVSSIELEFRYNGGPSTMFFHNRYTCPLYLENKECRECERIREIYDTFHTNLHRLQFGDTFRIKAALINNDQSVLPAEIHSFENYQPLLAACTEYRLRLPDTIEGVNKKRESFGKKGYKESFFNKLLDKLSPYFLEWLVKGVIVAVIVTVIGSVPLLMFGEAIKERIFTIFSGNDLDKLSSYFPGWLVKGVIVAAIGTFIGGVLLLMFGEAIKERIFTIFSGNDQVK